MAPRKRIVICADGTWNRPEEDLAQDFPTNVLRLARAVQPYDDEGVQQVVFYDWGIGADRKKFTGGAFGEGINKNIQDAYRFLVQNYDPGDELFFFGFSRGAYTVRSLAGMINNCGILRRSQAHRIAPAFEFYKRKDVLPGSDRAARWRKRHSVGGDRPEIHFIGVWDTVGALGIPLRVLGFLDEDHTFHDKEIGSRVRTARHALAIDEKRKDFEPTIWDAKGGIDLMQVWFAGAHADVGGSTPPDRGGALLSDLPLRWMMEEAERAGLVLEGHLWKRLRPSAVAKEHPSLKGFYHLLGRKNRRIPLRHWLHPSVRERYRKMRGWRPETLTQHLERKQWSRLISEESEA